MTQRQLQGRWATHFEGILNETDERQIQNYKLPQTGYFLEAHQAIVPDTLQIISTNPKAPGEDPITAELIKYGTNNILKVKIWDEEVGPLNGKQYSELKYKTQTTMLNVTYTI